MSCPHAETTTVAWCYGEADDAHAAHIASCEPCQAVVADHELVTGAVAPLAPALVGAGPPPVGAASAPPRRLLAPTAIGIGVALAAAALLAIGVAQRTPSPTPYVEPAPVPVATAPEPLPDDHVDARIDALLLELEALDADPSLL